MTEGRVPGGNTESQCGTIQRVPLSRNGPACEKTEWGRGRAWENGRTWLRAMWGRRQGREGASGSSERIGQPKERRAQLEAVGARGPSWGT